MKEGNSRENTGGMVRRGGGESGWTCDATNYVYKNNFYNTIYKNTTIIIIITVIAINIITIFFKAQFCHLYLTLSSADQIQKNIF